METANIQFLITIDPQETPFRVDDIYNSVEDCIHKVKGWENAIETHQVVARPVAGWEPTTTVALIALAINITGLTYTVVRNYLKDRDEKKSKIEEQKFREEELEQLKMLTTHIDELISYLQMYGNVSCDLKDE
jgi:hypothetical protein